jgi:hypothetical protein
VVHIRFSSVPMDVLVACREMLDWQSLLLMNTPVQRPTLVRRCLLTEQPCLQAYCTAVKYCNVHTSVAHFVACSSLCRLSSYVAHGMSVALYAGSYVAHGMSVALYAGSYVAHRTCVALYAGSYVAHGMSVHLLQWHIERVFPTASGLWNICSSRLRFSSYVPHRTCVPHCRWLMESWPHFSSYVAHRTCVPHCRWLMEPWPHFSSYVAHRTCVPHCRWLMESWPHFSSYVPHTTCVSVCAV